MQDQFFSPGEFTHTQRVLLIADAVSAHHDRVGRFTQRSLERFRESLDLDVAFHPLRHTAQSIPQGIFRVLHQAQQRQDLLGLPG